MTDPLAGWSFIDRAGALLVLMVITYSPLRIIEKLNRIITLLEQIARKD